eukprot:scaffold3598_cov57-Phaeocystis_antarctica.AAC.2
MAAGRRVIWTYARPAPGGGVCPGQDCGALQCNTCTCAHAHAHAHAHVHTEKLALDFVVAPAPLFCHVDPDRSKRLGKKPLVGLSVRACPHVVITQMQRCCEPLAFWRCNSLSSTSASIFVVKMGCSGSKEQSDSMIEERQAESRVVVPAAAPQAASPTSAAISQVSHTSVRRAVFLNHA